MAKALEFARRVDKAVKDYVEKGVDGGFGWRDPQLESEWQTIENLLVQADNPYEGCTDRETSMAQQWIKCALQSVEGIGLDIPPEWRRWVDTPLVGGSDLSELARKLRSRDVRVVRAAVHEIQEIACEFPEDRDSEVAEILSSLFYIDKYDRPDLQIAVDDALVAVSELGEPVIPFLIERMCESDLNATLCFCRALGRIGGAAVDPIMAAYEKTDCPYVKATALYALSKIQDRSVGRVFDQLRKALRDKDYRVRVAAGRAIGKFAETIPSLFVPRSVHEPMIDDLVKALKDANDGARAKAVRSLGKVAKFGCVDAALKNRARTAIQSLVGEKEDSAFLVRQEAEEALKYV